MTSCSCGQNIGLDGKKSVAIDRIDQSLMMASFVHLPNEANFCVARTEGGAGFQDGFHDMKLLEQILLGTADAPTVCSSCTGR